MRALSRLASQAAHAAFLLALMPMLMLMLMLMLAGILVSSMTSGVAAQFLSSSMVWEYGSPYQYDPDTCAFISDTTASDSAVFYLALNNNFAGYLPSFVIIMDSTGVGTLTWADSVSCTLYPRVSCPAAEADISAQNLRTLWSHPITLSLPEGTLCSNWGPTAEVPYLLGNSEGWRGRQYQGVTLVVRVAAKDALYVNRLTVLTVYNR